MYSASVSVNVTSFVPTNGTISPSSSIAASLSNLVPGSSTPDGVFSLNGNDIKTQLPAGAQGPVNLTFNLFSSDFTLVGIAFSASDSSGHAGLQQYPAYSIQRTPGTSSLTLVDSALQSDSGVVFTYGLIIQQVSTSLVGIFDPRDETDD